MECFSPLFRETLERTLDSAHSVIASVAKKGDRFIERIKKRPDVMLITVTDHNREALVSRVLETIASPRIRESS
jgi:nucleoside-triphosphatase THEP1